MKRLLTQINRRCVIITGLILAFISLFYTKAFDFGFVFLGLHREGEFLGLVLRLVDFILAFWLVYISFGAIRHLKVKICHFEHSEKSKTQPDQISHFVRNDRVTQNTEASSWQNISKQTIFTLVLFIALVLYWIATNSSTWYSFKNGILGYGTLFFSFALLYKYKPSWLLILVPYFCFDHIILSSSLVSLMLVLLGYFAWYTSSKSDACHCERSAAIPSLRNKVCLPEHPNLCHPELVSGSKNTQLKTATIILSILTLTITINLILAIYQVFSGHSLGLYFLGESKLELSGIIGIAKQALPNSDQILLRGYGLMPHPNILGFLGVFGMIFGLELKRFILIFEQTRQFYINTLTNLLVAFSILLGLISMSRMALISFVIIVLVYFVPLKLVTRIWKNIFLSLFIFTAFTAILTFVSFDFKADSDNYRLEQYQTMYKLIKKEPQILLLGTGIGQYSQHLKSANISTESWENEPFYHPLGNIILEFGLIGIVLTALMYKNLQESNCV